jgi:hypothetical protein
VQVRFEFLGPCEIDNEASGSIEDIELLGQLSDYQLHEKDSTACN